MTVILPLSLSQEAQDNARPYTNGTILLNSGPVHIVASEYRETKEKTPEPQKEASPEKFEPQQNVDKSSGKIDLETPAEKAQDDIEKYTNVIESNENDEKEIISQEKDDEKSAEVKENETNESVPQESVEQSELSKVEENDLQKEKELEEAAKENDNFDIEKVPSENIVEESLAKDIDDSEQVKHKEQPVPENIEEINILQSDEVDKQDLGKLADDFLNEERKEEEKQKETTPELLEEAIKEDSPVVDENIEENQSVKVCKLKFSFYYLLPNYIGPYINNCDYIPALSR